jgi:hypothetical protein
MSSFVEALASGRSSLLAIAERVQPADLARPTRNAGWAVADVLAHVIASDGDLISLVEFSEGAREATAHETKTQHDADMRVWRDAAVPEITDELRRRGERWRTGLEAAPPAAVPARAWWIDGERPLTEILADYLTHDAEHAEDVQLALDGQ